MDRRKLFAPLVFLWVALLLGSILALAQSPTEIDWAVVAGGGGASNTGELTVDDTLGQPVIGFAQAGETSLGAGYWYGMIGRPRAVDDLSASMSVSNVRLDWSAVTEDVNGQPISGLSYNVYRAINDPSFTPGTAYASGIEDPMYIDSDTSVLHNSDRNAFYFVTAVDSFATETDDSNRAGAFSFWLVPGSN